eukprot:TRINITY_DN3813_c0_g2_i11.p1 TRINITY_DN3813_c0_g2~~TRINITY_DN3813_c0_g2_i11.p1  ORF type:complete len:224 (+),score=52.08 TRINITY_DN3813_c0_g2_i11:168-839(+)
MDNCCRRSSIQRYEGIEVAMSDEFFQNYNATSTLSESDIKVLMQHIVYIAYNTRLYDKVELATKRSKELRNGITVGYVNLVRQAKELEDRCLAEAEAQVLEKFKITPKDFKNAKSEIDMEDLVKVITLELLRDIKKNKSKLAMDIGKVDSIREETDDTYNSCSFKLSAVPDTSSKLAEIYQDDMYLTYEDVMAADTLFPKYGLLPIEYQAFICLLYTSDAADE